MRCGGGCTGGHGPNQESTLYRTGGLLAVLATTAGCRGDVRGRGDSSAWLGESLAGRADQYRAGGCQPRRNQIVDLVEIVKLGRLKELSTGVELGITKVQVVEIGEL